MFTEYLLESLKILTMQIGKLKLRKGNNSFKTTQIITDAVFEPKSVILYFSLLLIQYTI